MGLPDWAPEGVQVDRPSAARIYDYLLGGSHNFAADRAVAEQAIAAIPDLVTQARGNRAFMNRAVRFLLGQGVRQFLDLGSGIPTVGNVHELVRRTAPDGRVVYVDLDPVAVAHSRHVLSGIDQVIAVQADMRRPAEILADERVRAVLDFDQPIAVLAVAVLHVISDDDDPFGAINMFRDAVPGGSYLVIAHGTYVSRPPEAEDLVVVSRQTTTPMTLRNQAEVLRFFDGFELVEPGLTWGPLWRPESPADVPDHPEQSGNVVGVGRKP